MLFKIKENLILYGYYILTITEDNDEIVIASSNEHELLDKTSLLIKEYMSDGKTFDESMKKVHEEITKSIYMTDKMETHYACIPVHNLIKLNDLKEDRNKFLICMLMNDSTVIGSEFFFFRIVPILSQAFYIPDSVNLENMMMNNREMDEIIEDYADDDLNVEKKLTMVIESINLVDEISHRPADISRMN